MKNIKTIDIWKKEEEKTENHNIFRNIDLAELNLSVRSYNCLRRANCNTVGDILDMMEEDGNGLRRIRNLGSHSEAEIKETVKKLQAEYDLHPRASAPFVKLVKPSKTSMSQQIDTFHLSRQTLNALHAGGYIQKTGSGRGTKYGKS